MGMLIKWREEVPEEKPVVEEVPEVEATEEEIEQAVVEDKPKKKGGRPRKNQ